tara:strand:- start:336 stop:602 length:267 start_codon:yes stop_codon:yes gene_type:complete
MEKMASQTEQENPISTLFGVVGAFVGFGYGAQFADGEMITPFIVALLGFGLGKFIGAIVVRLILIALVILGFVIRDQIMSSITEALFS